MIDILFVAHNRLEFTRESIAALLANTDWDEVSSVTVYDDGSTDGTREFLEDCTFPVVPFKMIHSHLGSPVAVTNDFVRNHAKSEFFAKIDNDTMLPLGWEIDCLAILEDNPEVDLLGIEAFDPSRPAPCERSARPAEFIGGIGLMRTAVFANDLPIPNGRFGFTEWQNRHDEIKKAWINPALPVFLLDHLPMNPWRSLSEAYIAKGWQRRQWGVYGPEKSQLWDWWIK